MAAELHGPGWRTGAPHNFVGYSNPAVDQALDAGDWPSAESACAKTHRGVRLHPHHLAVVDVRIKNAVLGPYDVLETLPEWRSRSDAATHRPAPRGAGGRQRVLPLVILAVLGLQILRQRGERSSQEALQAIAEQAAARIGTYIAQQREMLRAWNGGGQPARRTAPPR